MNQPAITDQIVVSNKGLVPYLETYNLMQSYTKTRDKNSADKIWFVEHDSIFTQGKVGKAEHLLKSSQIPVIKTNRGGQITYHAPGQQIMYILLDLKRLNIGIKKVVKALENCVIKTLEFYGVVGHTLDDMPGVYVNHQKICSLGLHVHKGCTMHGLALNIDMDLSPFNHINPCGYADLQMTKLSNFVTNIDKDKDKVRQLLTQYFIEQLTTHNE